MDKKEDVVEDPVAPWVSFPCGSVEFENVSFRYMERGDVLENVSFSIPSRSTSVLVGPSGAGKSTVVDLLMRFYDPVGGTITIDGHDLRKVRLCDLRAAVAVVEQTPFFFHSTIRENLAFAAPGASLAACEEAARRAEIHFFIDSLPDRYETVLGERGLTLSAGQRHRLAIARALLRNPAVLILDEPTAALDPNAEFALGETLRTLSQACTVVIVTHRPALVTIADHVIVLENGHVVESGPPGLLITGGSALSRHFRESLLPKTLVM
jgi:ABC-type multidrug transport system fused ATPase/permease subunit